VSFVYFHSHLHSDAAFSCHVFLAPLLFSFVELGGAIHTWFYSYLFFSTCTIFCFGFSDMHLWHLLQSLELWNMSENKTMTLPAHDGQIAALAVSTVTGMVASASHDKFVKLWK